MSQKRGMEHQVPCPWCEHRNDFQEIKFDTPLGGYEAGSTVQCDKCERHMEIVQVRPTTIITVRRAKGPKGVPRSIGGH